MGTQQRVRTISKEAKHNGTPCDELRDGVQLIRCRAETQCPATRNFISDESPFEYDGKIYITFETSISSCFALCNSASMNRAKLIVRIVCPI